MVSIKDRKILRQMFSHYDYVMTTAQLSKEKLYYRDIQRMLKAGLIEKVKRGYYHWTMGSGKGDVVIISRLFPDGILYMETALFYYGYSDRNPAEWNIAIDKNASRQRTRIDYPSIKAYRLEPALLSIGVTRGEINFTDVRIYDRDRTICDVLRNMNKMDKEIFNKAIQGQVLRLQKIRRRGRREPPPERRTFRNYKCRFDEQLLIYAQRPDAIAVAELDTWNKRFKRWVNKDSKGIAVFDPKGRRNTLKYYFDVSDTHDGYYGSRPVPIWQMNGRYEQAVIERLSDRFGNTESTDLASALMETAKNAVEDNLQDYFSQLKGFTRDSFLEELDDLNVEVCYRRLVTNSVAFMLMSRCGLDRNEHFDREDFEGIINFNTPATINALGIGAAPFALMGFVKYNGMNAEQFVWAWIKSEFLMPKKLMFQPDNLYYETLKAAIQNHEKEALKNNA